MIDPPRTILLGISLMLAAGVARAATPATQPTTQPLVDVSIVPSLVTMHFKDAKPKEIFDSLASQGHTTFRLFSNDFWASQSASVDLDLDQQPFWEAVRKVSAKTGIGVIPGYNGERSLTLAQGMPNNWFGAVHCISGPYLICGENIRRASDISFQEPGRPAHRQFDISASVFVEPKIRVVGFVRALKLIEAVDDKGNSLLPASNNRSPQIERGRGGEFSVIAPLQYPQKPGTRIARLKAQASLMVQTQSQTATIAIDDAVWAAKADPSRTTGMIASVRFSLLKIVKENGGNSFRVIILIYRDKLPLEAFNEFVQSIAGNSPLVPDLRDKNGRTLTFCGGNGSNSTSEGAQVTFVYSCSDRGMGLEEGQQPLAPTQLIWEYPTQTKMVEIPFEFDDLPMP